MYSPGWQAHNPLDMRRTIASLLILSLLVTSFELVMDFEEAWAEAHDPMSTSHALDDNTEKAPYGEPDCDHCCHGISHLTGMTVSMGGSSQMLSYIHLGLLADRYRSLRSPPLTQPPNA